MNLSFVICIVSIMYGQILNKQYVFIYLWLNLNA